MFTVMYYSKKGQLKQKDYDILDLCGAIEDGEAALRFDPIYPVLDNDQLIKVEIANKKWSKSNRVMRCSIIGKKEEVDGESNVVEWDLVDA